MTGSIGGDNYFRGQNRKYNNDEKQSKNPGENQETKQQASQIGNNTFGQWVNGKWVPSSGSTSGQWNLNSDACPDNDRWLMGSSRGSYAASMDKTRTTIDGFIDSATKVVNGVVKFGNNVVKTGSNVINDVVGLFGGGSKPHTQHDSVEPDTLPNKPAPDTSANKTETMNMPSYGDTSSTNQSNNNSGATRSENGEPYSTPNGVFTPVTQYDQNGNVVGQYILDKDGNIVDGTVTNKTGDTVFDPNGGFTLSQSQIDQLNNGGTVELPGGRKISRDENGTYSLETANGSKYNYKEVSQNGNSVTFHKIEDSSNTSGEQEVQYFQPSDLQQVDANTWEKRIDNGDGTTTIIWYSDPDGKNMIGEPRTVNLHVQPGTEGLDDEKGVKSDATGTGDTKSTMESGDTSSVTEAETSHTPSVTDGLNLDADFDVTYNQDTHSLIYTSKDGRTKVQIDSDGSKHVFEIGKDGKTTKATHEYVEPNGRVRVEEYALNAKGELEASKPPYYIEPDKGSKVDGSTKNENPNELKFDANGKVISGSGTVKKDNGDTWEYKDGKLVSILTNKGKTKVLIDNGQDNNILQLDEKGNILSKIEKHPDGGYTETKYDENGEETSSITYGANKIATSGTFKGPNGKSYDVSKFLNKDGTPNLSAIIDYANEHGIHYSFTGEDAQNLAKDLQDAMANGTIDKLMKKVLDGKQRGGTRVYSYTNNNTNQNQAGISRTTDKWGHSTWVRTGEGSFTEEHQFGRNGNGRYDDPYSNWGRGGGAAGTTY